MRGPGRHIDTGFGQNGEDGNFIQAVDGGQVDTGDLVKKRTGIKDKVGLGAAGFAATAAGREGMEVDIDLKGEEGKEGFDFTITLMDHLSVKIKEGDGLG